MNGVLRLQHSDAGSLPLTYPVKLTLNLTAFAVDQSLPLLLSVVGTAEGVNAVRPALNANQNLVLNTTRSGRVVVSKDENHNLVVLSQTRLSYNTRTHAVLVHPHLQGYNLHTAFGNGRQEWLYVPVLNPALAMAQAVMNAGLRLIRLPMFPSTYEFLYAAGVRQTLIVQPQIVSGLRLARIRIDEEAQSEWADLWSNAQRDGRLPSLKDLSKDWRLEW